MVDCPRCGTAFSAEAAELMMSMGIVAYADCPACRYEFLPFASQNKNEKGAVQRVTPAQEDDSRDWWMDG